MAALVFVLLATLTLYVNILSMAAQFGKDLSYLNFVYNATDEPLEAEYDYIIVGGGTTGCPLAATLSTKYSVLVLERGGIPQSSPDVLHSDGFLKTLTPKDDINSPAEEFISEDGVSNARGRVLGGSSMINVGIYSRADEDFYAESGIVWDMGMVKKAYEWVEETIIVSRSELGDWQSAFREALLESGVGPDNGFSVAHKQGTKTTGSTFDASKRRHGAVELLSKAIAKNLRVAVGAMVEKIIFSPTNSSGLFAKGVIYSDSNGKTHRAIVRNEGEVILSAGALGSPQLLLLSGVGPYPYISSLEIPVVHHQPYVGQFVHDNPRNGITIVLPFPIEHSSPKVVGITKEGSYIEAMSFAIPFLTPIRFGLLPNPSAPAYFDASSIVEKFRKPLSNGSLRLGSPTDVRVSPIVRFNYYAEPLDLANCVGAMRKIGQLLSTQSLERFKFEDMRTRTKSFKFLGLSLPVNQSDDASMEAFCRKTVTTFWHYHGGCTVGKVVDEVFKVMGINALRVVDGSIFTVSPGTNPQATLMMLGRYSGLKILEGREEKS